MSLCSNGDIIEAVVPAARKHIEQVSFCLSIAREVAFPWIQSIDRSILLLFSRSSSRSSEKRTTITPVLQARWVKEHLVYIVTHNCLLHISSSPHSHPKPHWGCFSIAWLGCFERFSTYMTRLEQVFRFLGRWHKIVSIPFRDLLGWKLTYGLQLLLRRSTSLCQFSSECRSRPCVWDKLSCVADILVRRKCLIIEGTDG